MLRRCDVASKFSEDATAVVFTGDNRSFLPTIPDHYVDLVVTSPPYNLGKSYERRSDLDTYIESQRQVIEMCLRVLTRHGSICWQVGNYVDNGSIIPLDILLYPIFAQLGLVLRNRVVWSFGHGLHSQKRFSGRYETILWFTRETDYFL